MPRGFCPYMELKEEWKYQERERRRKIEQAQQAGQADEVARLQREPKESTQCYRAQLAAEPDRPDKTHLMSQMREAAEPELFGLYESPIAHVRWSTVAAPISMYPSLPCDYLFELGGVDRVYSRRYDEDAVRHWLCSSVSGSDPSSHSILNPSFTRSCD